MKEKINLLDDLILETKKYPYNFFFFYEKISYYVFHYIDIKHIIISNWNYWIISDFNKIDRWKLLDAFSKLEFICWQIIFAEMNNYESIDFFDRSFYEQWKYVLSKITFYDRIKFLKNNWLITEKDKKKLYDLKEIRNELAHLVDVKHIYYKGVLLKKVYQEFYYDINSIWEKLLNVYDKIWKQEKLLDYMIKKLQFFSKSYMDC